MPKILESLVKTLEEKRNMDKSKAWAIATSALQKRGVLKKGTHELTKKGKK